MMNKKEVIEKIKKISAIETFMSETIWVKRDEVLDIIKRLDEPEKPVVPQFIDSWIQGAKYNGFDLYEAMTDEVPDEVTTWIVWHSETFAKAWLFGYKVEEEKLYTAKVNFIDDENHCYLNRNFGVCEPTYSFGQKYNHPNTGGSQTYFDRDELEEILVWNNPAFEIIEVEK